MPNSPEILMPERPKSDRDLSEDIVEHVLRDEFPSLDFHHVAQLGSGWAIDTYLVDGSLVLRFPRNAELAQWLDADEAILRLVASSIGSVLRVPTVILRGRGGQYFPYGFLGCEVVPGIAASDPRAPCCDDLAGDLGLALAHIHSIPLSSAEAIGLTRAAGDAFTGPLCFLHGDFSPDNIIVDPSTGQLVGIIDWGNAVIGDPALDFIWLVLWRGWAFARSVLNTYRLPVEEDLVERVRFHAQLQAVQWLADTVRRRKDPALPLSWVHNAFAMVTDL